jgi:hypothetical protein
MTAFSSIWLPSAGVSWQQIWTEDPGASAGCTGYNARTWGVPARALVFDIPGPFTGKPLNEALQPLPFPI